MARLLGVQL